ncbi:MAG: DNA polymerase IV [Gammaproteobacteria bacterium]|nr:DNA polymerase IV [Gammaproteobacteria bacterium]
MDAFFAAVELRRHPELTGKPLVIGGRGDPMQRGVVSTASYEARAFGVHSGMPLRTAYKLCPQAIFLPVDYDEYARISVTIKEILREFTPLLEDVGIDEAFLDISGLNTPSEQIAAAIKQKIRQQTALSCSIGIAPNKLLAKIASDMQKPDGLTIIQEGDVATRIWPLPVRKLPGVGPKTEARLKAMSITTIGDLAAQPLKTLTAELGKAHGQYLHEAAQGIDDSPLITHWEPKSSSREITFQHDIGDWQVLAKTLAALTRELVDSLKEEGYLGRTVTVKVRFSDFETHTREKTLESHTNNLAAIRHGAFDCLRRFELTKKVRLIGVRVGDLRKP